MAYILRDNDKSTNKRKQGLGCYQEGENISWFPLLGNSEQKTVNIEEGK
jgi:hypothetical protein